MSGKIMVGYDDSAAAQRALERGIEEARSSRSRLVVLAVAEMPVDPMSPRVYGTLDDIGIDDGRALAPPPNVVDWLGHAREQLLAAGIDGEFSWAAGDPARAILDSAETLRVRTIVLGTHHHGFLSGLFGTDVAAEVQEHAGCAVIVAD